MYKVGGRTATCRPTEETAQVPNIMKDHVRKGRMQKEGRWVKYDEVRIIKSKGKQ
jgi:hypothetical protein